MLLGVGWLLCFIISESHIRLTLKCNILDIMNSTNAFLLLAIIYLGIPFEHFIKQFFYDQVICLGVAFPKFIKLFNKAFYGKKKS